MSDSERQDVTIEVPVAKAEVNAKAPGENREKPQPETRQEDSDGE